MHTYDCIIAGGGLAGAMAGILLKKKGWKVLILEKSRYPRQKVCGEFLSPAVLPLLKQAEVLHLLKENSANEIDTVSLFWPSQKPIHTQLAVSSPEPFSAYGISRETLDDALLQEAQRQGCTVAQNQEAVRIEKTENNTSPFSVHARNSFQAEIGYSSRLVINAAGKQNRWEDQKRQRGPRYFGFKAHFRNIPTGRATELYFFEGGYLGILEVENGLSNICGKVKEKQLKETQGNFDLLLINACRQNPELAVRMKEAKRESDWVSCGPLAEGFKQGYKNGVFYAGDAACFVEPFLGQGMTLALASGFLLNAVLTRLPKDENELNQQGDIYEKNLKVLYRSKMNLGRFFNPFGFSLILGFFLRQFFSMFPAALDSLLQKTCALHEEKSSLKNCFIIPQERLSASAL